MTKELQLFKRWFGIDFQQIPSVVGVKFMTGWDSPIIHLYLADNSWNSILHGTNTVSKEEIETLININGFDKMFVSNFSKNNDSTFLPAVCFSYIVPSQYHAEWEQYVKEKNDE